MHFMIKATDHCNMNCTYCYVSRKQRDSGRHFPANRMPELFKQVFSWQQATLSRDHLDFNWTGGELLTLPIGYLQKAFDCQREAYRAGRHTFDVRNGVQTNLTLLDDAYFRFLRRNDVSIGTTLDGTRACMDKTRRFKNGRSAFDAVIGNLKRLIDVHGFRPGVILILTKHNVDRVDEIYQMFRDLNVGFQINAYHYAP